MPGFLDPEKLWDNNCCCFKPLSLEVIYYVAIDNIIHFYKYYVLNLTGYYRNIFKLIDKSLIRCL